MSGRTVEYRTGDLFAEDLPAYAHGVNVQGRMGAGIAKQFRNRCPGLYDSYRQACRDGTLTLGGVHVYRPPVGPIVYNLATQPRPGPYASLDAIRSAVTVMLVLAAADGVGVVGMPRVGAGIGGLAWPHVAEVLDEVAEGSAVRLVVVSLPDAVSGGEMGA